MVTAGDSCSIIRKLALDHIAAEREAERERAQWFSGIEIAERAHRAHQEWKAKHWDEHRRSIGTIHLDW